MNKAVSRKFFGISILILLVLVSLYLFLHSSFFNIEKITITGLKVVSEDEVLRLSGLSQGQNIFEINDEFVSKAIEIHPVIKKAVLLRHFPRQIEVEVQERKIWALLPYHDVLLCIDEDSICIDKLQKYSLIDYPLITMDDLPPRVNLGQAVEPEGVKMIKVIYDALSIKSRKAISDFHYINKSKEIVFYTQKGTEVNFGNLERLEEKTKFVEQVFEIEAELDEKGSDVLEYVDLRFKGQPVLKTRNVQE